MSTTADIEQKEDNNINTDVAVENGSVDNNSLKRPLESANEEPPVKKVKIKKKKYAMLLSYCGQGYYGMQINHGFKTIEGELFDAFLKLGVMDEEAHKSPNLAKFQRAARTDKGVCYTGPYGSCDLH